MEFPVSSDTLPIFVHGVLCYSFPLDFYFFFYLLVTGNSSTEELKLYNSLKHSLVLSIGYTYSAQSIDCTSLVNWVCFREPPFRSYR